MNRRSHETLAATVCHQFTVAQAKSSLGEARGHRREAACGLGQAGEPPIKPRAIVEDQRKPATVTRYPLVTAAARHPSLDQQPRLHAGYPFSLIGSESQNKESMARV
jgi:hypothetical protein